MPMGIGSSTRLTNREEQAIIYALGSVLADELQGFEDDEDAHARMVIDLQTAQQKMWARQERRRGETPTA